MTRVALSKSETAAAAGADRGDAAPCGDDNPPTFSAVVFFEGAPSRPRLAPATETGDVRRPGPERHRGPGGEAAATGEAGAAAGSGVDHRRRPGGRDHDHDHDVQRGHGVTRSAKTLIPAVVGVVAIAAFYFLVLEPEARGGRQARRPDRDGAGRDRSRPSSWPSSTRPRRPTTRPTTRRSPAWARPCPPTTTCARCSCRSTPPRKVEGRLPLDQRELGGGRAAARRRRRTAVTAPGAVPVGSAGFSAMPFKFAFTGSYFRLSDFFTRLEKFVTVENENIDVTGRLLLLGSIAVTPDASEPGQLNAEIGAATYIVPPPTASTARAGRHGARRRRHRARPAPTAAPRTTTATITGVR